MEEFNKNVHENEDRERMQRRLPLCPAKSVRMNSKRNIWPLSTAVRMKNPAHFGISLAGIRRER